ncbi:hypothetical protein JHJ32_21160 [Parapedobacter sp. ISTM3]|uniref:hypothetical protein n=1 Tax=Parapedobacter sp. ISTM3 TaxID=2800130 RepID=UPI0019038F52|nr:hypothetical protein [Parapedobacter sp. ISTM3]MBK1442522.1 hypothetical protein [Parapedobacter sp. ISTM3]
MILPIILCMLAACSDFFEESVADSELELLSPGQDAETNVYVINFLWEPLDHALQYRLQLASPSFDSVTIFHADTTLDRTLFSISLQPGTYQWRVKALNGSSSTAYTTRSFIIHEAALSTQTVLQVSPPNNFITNQSEVEVSWQGIFSAKNYRLQIDTAGFADEEELLFERVIDGTSFTFEMPDEQRYQWRVRAENDTAQSRWSAMRSFLYDETPPPAPALASPSNGAQVNRPVTLRWNSSGDAAAYQLYVYKSDSTLFNEQFPRRLEGTSHVFDAGARGERILWRVRATDRAGNESGYSSWRSFIVRN